MSPKKSATTTAAARAAEEADVRLVAAEAPGGADPRPRCWSPRWSCSTTRGWAETTLADVAEAAGVAVETIYNGFRSKKQLVRDAMEAAVVGDAEPLCRTSSGIRSAGSARARVRSGSRSGWTSSPTSTPGPRECGARSATPPRATTSSRRGCATASSAGKLDTVRSLERIFERPITGPMVDAVWMLYGPESYWKLVQVAGLSRAEYQATLAEATLRLLG